MDEARITESEALDAFYARQRGAQGVPEGAVQLGFMLSELQMADTNAKSARARAENAMKDGAKHVALRNYADALGALAAEISHDFLPGVLREHSLKLVIDKKFKPEQKVESVPGGRFGQIVGYIPGGYEVRWEVARSDPNALTYENDETLVARFEEE